MGLFDSIKQNIEAKLFLKKLNAAEDREDQERSAIIELEDLTPQSIDGHNRRYHYKDVNIWVVWQFSGHYGKSLNSSGMRRGDSVDLRSPRKKDEDPKAIAVYWKGNEIGYMKSNRLRDMVHQWKAAGLPVRAIISQVGGEQKVYIEFAFYGIPTKK